MNNNLFIGNISQIKCNYGGCSSVVECETVALETRVRFTPPACLVNRTSINSLSLERELPRILEKNSRALQFDRLKVPENQNDFLDTPPASFNPKLVLPTAFKSNSLMIQGGSI